MSATRRRISLPSSSHHHLRPYTFINLQAALPPARPHPVRLPPAHLPPPPGVFFLRDLLRAGVRTLRLELVDEAPQAVAPLLEGYR